MTDASPTAPLDPASATPPADAPTPVERSSRGLRRIPMLRALVTSALLALTIAVVFGNILPTRARLVATQDELTEQQARNAHVEQRLEELGDEAVRLETDPWTVERILRDELHHAPEGDVRLR